MTRHWLAVCAVLGAAGCSPAGRYAEKSKQASEKPQPKIVQFYPSPPVIAPGDPANICYGVENTASLRLDPPVETLKPSYVRCFQVSPKVTTTYTLTAISASGAEVSQSFALTVDPTATPPVAESPVALILFFTPSATQVRPNQSVTICYGVKGAAKVSLKPNIHKVQPIERDCFSRTFQATVTLTLTAFDAQGRRDSEAVTIRVKAQ